MNKITVKLAILLVVLALVYSVFWFFKVGQVEKQINNFITENSANISVGQIAVSGFPLSQKITLTDLKFTIPSAALNKRQTLVKHLEAKAGIFSGEFLVTALEQVSVHDAENNVANLEFSKEPEIKIIIADGRIAKFSYQDFGYRILDAEKNTIYAATSTVIGFESAVGEGDKINGKFSAQVKDVEGFDLFDIYKNAAEKKVIEGIKTGEFSIGNSATALLPAQANPSIVDVITAPGALPPAVAAAVIPVIAAATSPNPPAPGALAADAVVPAAPVEAQVDLTVAVNNSNLVKSNFMLEAEYTLTPAQAQQQAQVPVDPTQIQEMPVQYSKVVKINNLELSNPLYKISVNGLMNVLQDDNMPSGSISIKVEKIDNLISYVTSGLNQMVEQKKATAGVQSADLVNNNAATPADEAYHNFLTKISTGLNAVSKEMAAKNPVTKDDVAVFDLRREKNLEFLVNETPVREVLGKF